MMSIVNRKQMFDRLVRQYRTELAAYEAAKEYERMERATKPRIKRVGLNVVKRV